jgi:hypothetical protein
MTAESSSPLAGGGEANETTEIATPHRARANIRYPQLGFRFPESGRLAFRRSDVSHEIDRKYLWLRKS